MRGGDIVGEYIVYFVIFGERLELIYKVSLRMIFVLGVVRVVGWLKNKLVGFYDM